VANAALQQMCRDMYLLLFDDAFEFIAFEVKNRLIHKPEHWKLRTSWNGNARVVQGGYSCGCCRKQLLGAGNYATGVRRLQPLAKQLNVRGRLGAHEDGTVGHDKCGARALKKTARLEKDVIHDHQPSVGLDDLAHEAAGHRPQREPQVT
jgi:hypothetical protein